MEMAARRTLSPSMRSPLHMEGQRYVLLRLEREREDAQIQRSSREPSTYLVTKDARSLD
jgi:hypothetical protein